MNCQFFLIRQKKIGKMTAKYSLPCFALKGGAYEFFPGGHPQRSGVTLSEM